MTMRCILTTIARQRYRRVSAPGLRHISGLLKLISKVVVFTALDNTERRGECLCKRGGNGNDYLLFLSVYSFLSRSFPPCLRADFWPCHWPCWLLCCWKHPVGGNQWLWWVVVVNTEHPKAESLQCTKFWIVTLETLSTTNLDKTWLWRMSWDFVKFHLNRMEVERAINNKKPHTLQWMSFSMTRPRLRYRIFITLIFLLPM